LQAGDTAPALHHLVPPSTILFAVQFRILGTVEVADDEGHTVDVGGPRERTLLARLLVSVNRMVPAEQLADDIWAGHPPQHSPATLRVYISRLRQALGPAAAALITQPPGYRLDVEAGHLDSARFERLVADGRGRLEQGQPELAAGVLRRALELWRGDALRDVADLPFARPEVARLEELHLAAIEDRVEADLRCGRHVALCGELDALVIVHPLRERLWSQLMLALYRCGRQADALAAYMRVEATLGDDLGIDPGPDLRRLRTAVLRQDPELDWRSAPYARPVAGPRRSPVTLLLTDDAPDPGPALGPAVAAHRGTLATDVDARAALGIFESPTDAVAAAADLLRAVAARPAPLTTRAAVHTGEVEEREGAYVGGVVNRAARLCSAAHGGQVLLSQVTAELVRDHLAEGCSIRDLGLHHLEGMLRPERVHQLVVAGLPTEFPPLRAADPWAANLPPETTSFVGREGELRRIADLLGRSRLLTLTGPAGSGKSRLALRAGALLSRHYADGVWLVQLAPIAGAHLVVPVAAAVLSVREEAARPLLDSVAARLQACEALLILDNCEHVLDGVGALAAVLLDDCPSLRLLATSQVRLGVHGEASWPVPPLIVPAPAEGDPHVIAEAEAVRLFQDRAAVARPGFELTRAIGPAVAEICRRLDGIPLAVELAAAQLAALTPAQLAARLDDRFRVLATRGPAELPRHRTLRAALEWSHGLLTPIERLCFRRMAVFAGGCTIDALEAVASGGGLPLERVLGTVGALIDRSLLTTEERAGSMRYGMLETVLHFARERLDEAGEAAAVRRRHMDWLVELARRSDLEGLDQAAWLDLLEAEHGNFRAALEWSLEAGEAVLALALAGALAPFWMVRGHFSEGRRWLDAVLRAAGPDADPSLRAAALHGAGQLATVQSDFAAQRRYQEESLAIWRALGDPGWVARCLVDLGFMAHIQGDFAAALARHTEGLEVARRAGDGRRTANALSGLGMLALHQDDLDRSTACYQESMERFRELGDVRRATLILGNLGVVARNQGRFELARERFEEHLANARAIGDRKLQAGALTNLGTVAQDLGDLARSAELHSEALALTEQLGDRRLSAVALTNLGLVAQARGDYVAARRYHGRSLDLSRAYGEPRSVAEGLEELARVDAAEGRFQRAASLLGASRAVREAVGAPIPGPDVARFEEAAASVRSALGDEPFRAAWVAGRALALDDAVALARSGSGPSQERRSV
jgi:predicted ATPase/DNA-binding SARP family transcriptional activator